MITSNTSPTGELDTDSFRIAMLQYRNTPDPETKVSPAVCVFGRPIKDFIPVLPGRYEPHPTWKDTLDRREEALRARHVKAQERWTEHTKRLPPLKVGDLVRVQNQVGHHPTKWDKSGVVIEVRQFDQYAVRVDGSGRATLRNRKFLRRYVPVRAKRTPLSITNDMPQPPASSFTPFIPHNTTRTVTPTPAHDDSPRAATPDAIPFPSTPAPLTPSAGPPMVQDVTPPATPLDCETPSPFPASPPRTPLATKPRTPSVEKNSKRTSTKPPLALRRLASYNPEGRKGLGEYKVE